tara:strand:+ start:1546 stop:2355 length:810 start_codon:yes stop_codon:yes gene_type:complete
MNNICFIIAHKYFRGYTSYLEHYIENIQKFYPEALTIVVDNNSNYKEDVFSLVEGKDRVVFLNNDSDSKFELGAYRVGSKYVLDNGLEKDYNYFVFAQDTFVLKNKYDFKLMKEESCYAKPINSMYADGECADVVIPVMTKLGLNDSWDKVNFCWCCSFIVEKTKIEQLHNYLDQIKVTCRWESCAGERYLARILWELNEHKDCGAIDGSASDLAVRHYDTWNVNVFAPSTSYFVKQVQQKNENTVDKDTAQPIIFVPHNENKDDHNRG